MIRLLQNSGVLLLRYVRLYGYFVRFSLSRALEFRVDFYFRVLMDALYYTVNILFYKLIFLHTGKLGGWNEAEAMIFVATYLVVDAVNMTVFANNMWWLPTYINRGDLDYYLIRPVSSFFFLSFRDFAANSFLNLLISIGIMIWAMGVYPGPLRPGGILLLIIFIFNGAFLYHLVRMLTVIPVFWMQSSRGFETIFWSLARFMERPDSIFTGWVRRILLSVLPFCLVASLPARFFLESFSWLRLLHILLVTGIFLVLVLLFWRAGLRAYSSASS